MEEVLRLKDVRDWPRVVWWMVGVVCVTLLGIYLFYPAYPLSLIHI